MTERHTDSPGRIVSEPRGPHWVAWIADANGKPEQSIVLVGQTKEQVEERVRRWKEEQNQST